MSFLIFFYYFGVFFYLRVLLILFFFFLGIPRVSIWALKSQEGEFFEVFYYFCFFFLFEDAINILLLFLFLGTHDLTIWIWINDATALTVSVYLVLMGKDAELEFWDISYKVKLIWMVHQWVLNLEIIYIWRTSIFLLLILFWYKY